MRTGTMRKWATGAAAAAVAGLAAAALVPGCSVGYVLRSAYFQAELLAHRVPVAELRSSRTLTAEQSRSLEVIAEAKEFGRRIGLASTDNYETVAADWHRTIYNVTACRPLEFRPRQWWFPIVGSIHYLGYFRVEDATTAHDRLARRGLDVYVRTAGAYSTLGWFRDPVLPDMLEWEEWELAETVLHELVHATLWVRGGAEFNESFAGFTGEIASVRYLADRYGADSEPVRSVEARLRDAEKWRGVQLALYQDLETVYGDASLPDEEKLHRKSALYAGLVERIEGAGFVEPERYKIAAGMGPWNNARLVQFRTYNGNRQWFQAVLDRHGGDLLAFIEDVGRIARSEDDPFAALEKAARGTGI